MAEAPPSISVALCTYNGAAYLGEQLASIARQTCLPAEVVLSDDGSTDSTLEIAREFARGAPFPVRISQNEKNLGLAQNFGHTIGLCAGDLIALADQDDVWHDDKLARIVGAFERDPELGLIFTDADLVGPDLTPLGKRLSDTGRVGEAERAVLVSADAFAFLLRRNVATGATMAFRAGLREVILPIPEDLLTYHDAWIVQIAAATGRIAFLPEPLMQYRQHPGQHTWDFVYVHGARRVLDRAYYRAHLRQLVALRNRLAAVGLASDSTAIRLVDSNARHLRRRSSLPASRLARLAPIFFELLSGRYGRFSNGLRSAARDLLGDSAGSGTADLPADSAGSGTADLPADSAGSGTADLPADSADGA